MGEVIEILQKRTFNLENATQLLPVIRRLTKEAHGKVKILTAKLGYTMSAAQRSEIEESIYEHFQLWQDKMMKLGCDAKGMWLVDFDTGDGYLCWRFPEPEILYYHGYADGFRGRAKIH